MPAFVKSIRFRLTVQYSAVVFGLGGGLLGIVFLAIRKMLREQTMTGYVITGQPVYVGGVLVGQVPTLQEHELRTLESMFNEHVLNELARYTAISIAVLFLLSLVVGWVMSGRFLKPIGDITGVASDIQASDLSRRINLQGPDDELTRLASTFDRMLERLDRAFTSQRRFLADTSHDLRTPLTVIRSNVDVVASDEGATIDDWKEVGGIVSRNVEKMSEMIAELLAAARLQTGKAQAVTFDLSSIVSSKPAEYARLAEESGVAIGSSTSPVVVQGVAVALDRALSNLLDNAMGVSRAGQSVTIGCGVFQGWAWMAVADDGPGLPEIPEGGRTGLGLSIVEQIADAHGGSLAVFAGKGDRGTTMVVWLPVDGSVGDPPSRSPFTSL